MTNAFKRELIAYCKKKKVPVYDRDSTTNIAKRLQKKINEKHKKVGRPPKVEVTVAKMVLKRKNLGETGSADVLIKRVNKHDAKKTPKKIEKKDIMKINKVNVKADDLQELLNLPVGTQCEFLNGVVKTLKECSTGGYRWKTEE
jgi:phage tail sheath gpL-like